MDKSQAIAHIKSMLQDYADGFFAREFPSKTQKLAEFIADDGYDMTGWRIFEIDRLPNDHIITFVKSGVNKVIGFDYDEYDQKWYICYLGDNKCYTDATSIADAVANARCPLNRS